jgi:hypothetical protein
MLDKEERVRALSVFASFDDLLLELKGFEIAQAPQIDDFQLPHGAHAVLDIDR